MATDYKPADANKDGKVTPKEKAKFEKTKATVAAAAKNKSDAYEPAADKLNKGELEARFGYAKDVIFSNPELRALWNRAINEKWTDPALFKAELQSTGWFKENAEYARKAWAARQLGGADWESSVEEAGQKIEAAATRVGAVLTPQQKKSLTDRYINEGWGEAARAALMDDELAKLISTGDSGFMRGDAGNFQEKMMETARRNGLSFSKSYYESAARSVASGLMTEEDFLRDAREQAASMWGPWSDKIRSGMDAQDLASGYISMMAQTMEVDPESISLSDPRLTKAIMRSDDKGNPSPMGLYDFQMSLRDDPAWMQTKQATDSVSSIGMDILKAMGFQA